MKKASLLSKLPSVDEIINHGRINEIVEDIPRTLITEKIRKTIEKYRKELLALKDDNIKEVKIDTETIVDEVLISCKKFMEMNLKEVINGTGVVLHTNLGRSILADELKEEIWAVASGYSTLEIDVETGKRGSRYSHVVELIRFITGAEDALVVNNNAAAVMLVLSTLGKDKEVIVSRGELVEIGGSFRIPDVMEQSGAKLVDVGATNKTHLWDYENAIGENTAALMKVHTSNYRILGFTEEISLKDMVELGKRRNIPVIEDLGSGVLIDLKKYGLTYEPTVQDSVAAGTDIVTFSGDKLLGGPQAGIIIGKKQFIDKMKKNPLTRAFRIDKLTIAALEATLRCYLREDYAVSTLPTLKMITEGVISINDRAEKLLEMITDLDLNMKIEIHDDYSQIGGGALPLEKLPTKVLKIKANNISTAQLEERLRHYEKPIFTRIQDDILIIDIRTIKERDFKAICDGLRNGVLSK
ncbi:L-seryl-tRNA(Sec) selenium transferase [Alkaliphilus peptidifermentans]|uniref:L-seryl-tRNA(Sec) selenium transferase n=1 Tax=Alkaliphilus peptidifermentans DSM 18978 TaxID=1120976 RepID=A0A1G5J6S7_9FIRM|nr:L-seryl-tRNA(Sec) selenium transferase [Alkaliphilus peptidifermentans]SCY83904.1 L-seryl-tRNA(Sec) selenium transferase [Alkaliphilus peptidifermentans DSM 18978]